MSVTTMPKTAGEAEAEEPTKGGKKKLVIIVAVVLLVLGGAGWKFLMPHPEPAPEPGKVVVLDPIQINLASSHYLRVGIALQLTTTAHEADGSEALDALIDQFSGRPMDEVADTKKRRAMKKELEHHLEELYHGDVMEVYFTEFVTQ